MSRRTKDASKFATKIESTLGSNKNLETVTVDKVGKEVFVAYKIQGGYQSSFTVKNKYPSQFQDGGPYAVNNTVMLPEFPDEVDSSEAVSRIEDLISEMRLSGKAKVTSQSVPDSDNRAVRISFDQVELDNMLEFIDELADKFNPSVYTR